MPWFLAHRWPDVTCQSNERLLAVQAWYAEMGAHVQPTNPSLPSFCLQARKFLLGSRLRRQVRRNRAIWLDHGISPSTRMAYMPGSGLNTPRTCLWCYPLLLRSKSGKHRARSFSWLLDGWALGWGHENHTNTGMGSFHQRRRGQYHEVLVIPRYIN